jgi:FAD/FMN-containing dehydrogenase
MARVLQIPESHVTVEAGITVEAMQAALAADGVWFPPAPTFTGACAGGLVGTNAAGAATFKYGSTLWISYRRGFESRWLDYAVWGHVSDGNVHPNVIPRSYDDVVRGKEAILDFGREVARLGGCPLAEEQGVEARSDGGGLRADLRRRAHLA